MLSIFVNENDFYCWSVLMDEIDNCCVYTKQGVLVTEQMFMETHVKNDVQFNSDDYLVLMTHTLTDYLYSEYELQFTDSFIQTIKNMDDFSSRWDTMIEKYF